MSILVTGGCGYIGSHTVVELLNKKEEVIIIDNLSNSKKEVLDKIKEITGVMPKFYYGDIKDETILNQIFSENNIEAVIHFAGLKAVGESCQVPLKYYDNNIGGTINLLEVMEQHNCHNIIFSSSATVYGEQEIQPIKEDSPIKTPTNPYGKTKAFIEHILKDLYTANKDWNIVLLRYFNPIGAHPSGLIGEEPNGIPNNLMPYITQVAAGIRDHLNVFGNDYPTPDGTGVRDYLHVCDLSLAHVLSLDRIREQKGLDIYNVGTGKGSSVLDIIKAFEEANHIQIPYVITKRREGDIAENYADVSKIYNELGFKCEKTLYDMCKDSWNFQKHLINK